MKLIDLINKMYKNQVEPGFKFTLQNKEFTLNTYEIRNCEYGLMIYDLDNDSRFDREDYILDYLDYEVEIVEEKPKKIDNLLLNSSKQLKYDNKFYTTRVIDRVLIEKINELTEAVNYLLEKSDKDE